MSDAQNVADMIVRTGEDSPQERLIIGIANDYWATGTAIAAVQFAATKAWGESVRDSYINGGEPRCPKGSSERETSFVCFGGRPSPRFLLPSYFCAIRRRCPGERTGTEGAGHALRVMPFQYSDLTRRRPLNLPVRWRRPKTRPNSAEQGDKRHVGRTATHIESIA